MSDNLRGGLTDVLSAGPKGSTKDPKMSRDASGATAADPSDSLDCLDDSMPHLRKLSVSSMESTGDSYSRAVAYLKHRYNNPALSGEKYLGPKLCRVEDLFSSQINHCEPTNLSELRVKRANISPIVCYESDEEREGNSKRSEPMSNFPSLHAEARPPSSFGDSQHYMKGPSAMYHPNL